MLAAAGVAIGSAEPQPSTATVVGVVAVFVVVSSVSVSVTAPLVAYLVGGQRVADPLRRARDWLEAHNSAVMAVVFVVLGAMVLFKGLGAL